MDHTCSRKAYRLEQRREKANKGFAEFFYPASLSPAFEIERFALQQVLEEDGFQAADSRLVIDDTIEFEVIFQAAEVHIRRADRSHLTIHHYQLGMEKAVGIEVYMYTGLQEILHIGEGSHLWQTGIASFWYQQVYIDAGQGCRDESIIQSFGRKEVRSLDIDMFAGTLDTVDGGLLDGTPLPHGAGAYELYLHTLVGYGYRQIGIVAGEIDDSSRYDIPVQQETALQTGHHIAHHTEVSIAPQTEPVARVIAIGHIHTAQIAYFTIYNGYLPVIAVVYAAGQYGEEDRHKRIGFHSGSAQSFPVATARSPRTHMIEYDPHLHALLHLAYKQIGQATAQMVILYDVELNMYMVAGSLYVAKEAVEHILPCREYIRRRAEHDGAVRVVVDQLHDGIQLDIVHGFQLCFGDGQIVRLQHDALVYTAADNTPSALILSEKDIDNKPQDGYKRDDQNPRSSLQRIAILADNDGTDGSRHQHVYDY